MSSKVDLRLDWCSHSAAKFAVKNWHYSKTMPVGKLVKIGIWEDSQFIGCVLFGMGACPVLSAPYKLKNTEACELVRVALKKHKTSVSRIVSISLKMLKKHCPGLKVIVSYADQNQGHAGAIYQAGNWFYEGQFAVRKTMMVKGEIVHSRTVGGRYGTHSIDWLRKNIDRKAAYIDDLPKHKYFYPLDKEMKEQIKHLSKPYPKKPASEA